MRRLALLIVGLGVCGCGGPTSPTDLAFVRYALPIKLSETDPASPYVGKARFPLLCNP